MAKRTTLPKPHPSPADYFCARIARGVALDKSEGTSGPSYSFVFLCVLCGFKIYSYRSAIIGSTFVALRAGMYDPARATITISPAAPARVRGSLGLI